MSSKGEYSKQPCWYCAKFVDGCSWALEGKPIKGWDAKRSYKIQSFMINGKWKTARVPYSYKIKSCPEYVLEQTRCYPGTKVPLGIELDFPKSIREARKIYGFTRADIQEVFRQRAAYKPERSDK